VRVTPRLPPTEEVDPHGGGLDLLGTPDLVARIVVDQHRAVDAVLAQRDAIAGVVEEIAARLRAGGRLHYVGAGSSGRIGALDAAEMPPTFGTAPHLVRATIAGGPAAMAQAVEGAEDDAGAGEAAMRAGVRSGDAVVGISASGGSAFVVAAMDAARKLGAYAIGLTSVAGSPLVRAADVAIVVATGPEVLAGSTRLKAATAQKIALNAISTAVMVRLGHVHHNLMVDVVATNRKLRERALRLLCGIAGIDEARARELLEAAGGRVKVAIVMERRGVGAAEAEALLAGCGGSLRALL
jgi:N-acetylmuramic acid 6-phosphate etherase